MTKDDYESIYRNGFRAYEPGDSEEDLHIYNPFDSHVMCEQEFYSAWEEGWKAARDEAIKELFKRVDLLEKAIKLEKEDY